ncbi:MAG: hypothetical protein ABR587_03325 [Candidatus Binatia bacterium]
MKLASSRFPHALAIERERNSRQIAAFRFWAVSAMRFRRVDRVILRGRDEAVKIFSPETDAGTELTRSAKAREA